MSNQTQIQRIGLACYVQGRIMNYQNPYSTANASVLNPKLIEELKVEAGWLNSLFHKGSGSISYGNDWYVAKIKLIQTFTE